ncbi:MAG: hypothetical protein ACRDIB_06715, partial [Ardenticatenaceae bacterium]
MSLQQQLQAELERRTRLLPEEVALWQTLANEDQQGLGIHRSQFRVVGLLFDELAKKQQGLLEKLDQAQNAAEFAQHRLSLEDELTAVHGIMAVFRLILAQREDQDYFRTPLDIVDLVAAYAYQFCTSQAVDWGLRTEDEVRVPPLSYLNARFSPAAFTRR